MDGDRTSHFQCLLDRLNQGDDAARRELVGCAYERLRLLARRLLHQEFPSIELLHSASSVVHETALKLLKSLEEIRPETVRDLFGLAALRMRWVLLEWVRKAQREKQLLNRFREEAGHADGVKEPLRELLEALLRAVENLSEEERVLFDLIGVQGLTQAEAAKILGLHPRTVSHRWKKTRLRLADSVDGFETLL
ncbi:MAG TPA: sigma-70 family RNA polymerase sigma factor [Gemmataceae bacterium]|nr:sigma-70 family RNA polymerase sigma factor [Gemmataceae bacterium]